MIKTHFKSTRVEEVIKRCERQIVGEVMCPLCGGKYALQTLEKHLGLHLQDVALFSLSHLSSSKSWSEIPHLGEGCSKRWSKIPHLDEGSNESVSETVAYSSENLSENLSEDLNNNQSVGCQLISELSCICSYQHDDGFLIQCDKCDEFQHCVCMGIDEGIVPEVYECSVCKPGDYNLDIETAIEAQERFLKSEKERREKEREEREEREREEREERVRVKMNEGKGKEREKFAVKV